MSDDTVLQDAIARGKPISAKRAAQLIAELDAAHAEAAQWKETNAAAAQTLTQKDGQIAQLESQLGQAHEGLAVVMAERATLSTYIARLEDARKRDNTHAFAEMDRLQARLDLTIEQLGYLGRLVEILRDAAAPAATALFNIAQQPGIDTRTRETIQQTLAPLDAALAATKGDNKE
jgi:chromosome segregation ATPase